MKEICADIPGRPCKGELTRTGNIHTCTHTRTQEKQERETNRERERVGERKERGGWREREMR